MKIALATALIGVTSATTSSSNPFAPKVTPNNADSKRIGRLLSSATPLRQLDGSGSSSYTIDISKYSLRFEKCSTVKQYNANNNYQESDTVLSAKRFVIFRLCPNHSCGSCDENYGEYLIDMESYLDAMLQYKYEEQTEYCTACETCYTQAAQANNDMGAYYDDATQQQEDDDGCGSFNLDSCYKECLNIANMESNGYVDAADYVGCVKVYENENKGLAYWAGATCNANGSRIKIGLFTDEDCNNQDDSANTELYMKNDNGYNVKLSYHLLKHTFVNGYNNCITSCADYEDGSDYAQTAEVCDTLYDSSAKCETSHAFNYRTSENSQNWMEEMTACDFIEQVNYGTYDASGEIVVTGGRMIIQRATSSGAQRFFLTFFVWGTIFMSAYVALLYHKIMKGQKSLLSAHAKDGAALA
eukprot:CAMPEP_0113417088 /NCGR_PEP_ID=MMETSP0013_2-20120614/25466_1 /TAXON_ID=2843 ORGANISM="Skeletonema costatum, Strain 1716" /NCGR_SAMPLE_ID=MMETSP0013_2 /ASSEMBLY_ACC=CAM_ASM_000158 /LENGTH=414 /DNA_ID=CAMNT_0000304193 /DNA_START=42 /DNA_END=1286 /DNA_ORIENTATION=+ /assembly_acc=CAM_ASM_000158